MPGRWQRRHIVHVTDIPELKIWSCDKLIAKIGVSGPNICIWCCRRYRHTIVQMQFAIAAVIIQAIRDVRILLNLDKMYPGPDGVDCTGGNVKIVSGRHFFPVHQPFNLARK